MTTSLPSYLERQAFLYRLAQARTDATRGGEHTHNPISFTDFKRAIYRRYEHAAHLDKMDWALTQASLHAETRGEQGLSHIIVEMPPRHGKTVTISRLYPTWHLGRNPDHRVILASYGATLAYKNSRYARNVLLSAKYQQLYPDVTLAEGSKSTEAWDIADHEGGLDAMGVGGGVTGKGGHIIVVDDPVKSREEAESEVYREKVWDWFTDDIYSRREPGAAIIVVMTRWHMDDLAGRLLTNDPDLWHEIKLSALAEANDPLGRSEGAALWSTRFPVDVLLQTKKMMGEYSWAALYQQTPIPQEGGLFKRNKFNLIDVAPRDITRCVRFWDLALSEKESADYTVGVLMGETTGKRPVVLDVQRFQAEWDDVVPRIARVAVQDGKAVQVGVETAFYQTRAVKKLLERPELHQFSIQGYKPDKDKWTRALPFAARVGEGDMVYVLRSTWTEDYLDELCAFPFAAKDDQVDASSGAYLMLDNAPLTIRTSSYIGRN